MKLDYPYRLEPQEEGGFIVQFLDLEEAFTQGESKEECAFNAREVLSAILESRLDHGDVIPLPGVATGENIAYTSPTASVQAALLIRLARGEKTLSELAYALETSWPSVQRLENPHHWPTLKQLDRAAASLGKRLVLPFE